MRRPPLRRWPALVILSQACGIGSFEWIGHGSGAHRENDTETAVDLSGVDVHSGTPLPMGGPAARPSDLDVVVIKVNDSGSAWSAGTGGYGYIISCAMGTDASEVYVAETPPLPPPLSPSSLPSPSPTASSLAPVASLTPYQTPRSSPFLPTPRSALCPSPSPSPSCPPPLISSPPAEDNLCEQGSRKKKLSRGCAAGVAMACMVLHLAICTAGAIWRGRSGELVLVLAERSTQASPGGKLHKRVTFSALAV